MEVMPPCAHQTPSALAQYSDYLLKAPFPNNIRSSLIHSQVRILKCTGSFVASLESHGSTVHSFRPLVTTTSHYFESGDCRNMPSEYESALQGALDAYQGGK
jgi:hypothetical protein